MLKGLDLIKVDIGWIAYHHAGAADQRDVGHIGLAAVIYKTGLVQKGITTCKEDEMTFSTDLSWMSNHHLSAGPDR